MRRTPIPVKVAIITGISGCFVAVITGLFLWANSKVPTQPITIIYDHCNITAIPPSDKLIIPATAASQAEPKK